MSDAYILSIDQGTASSRAIIYDGGGKPVAQHRTAHRQIYPEPGWVSHDPAEIYHNVEQAAYRAVEASGALASQIAAVGITNQRETLVAWDADTGEPVCDAVVWLCNRSADICARALADGMESEIRAKTGLLVDPYFSATKLRWILDNVPRAAELAAKGRLLAGTVDCWLVWKLSGGKAHVTDYSNASRTMLFNIHTLKWDEELLRYFGVPRGVLPEVVPSSGIAAYTDESIFGAGIPITGIAGDQSAALFGQTCFAEGDMKNTYGTGCFILKNIGEKPVLSENRLLTTIAWSIGGKTTYALEGSIFNAGAAVEWLIGKAKLAVGVGEIQSICESTPDTGDVYFVPAFAGLGAPHWDMSARGSIFGMTLSAGKNEIVRAAMEAIAFQCRDVVAAADAEAGAGALTRRLRVDGGVSASDFLMQFQADILGILVERPRDLETTALGAAYLAGLGAGVYGNLANIASRREIGAVFHPSKDAAWSGERYARWRKAVEKAKGWA